MAKSLKKKAVSENVYDLAIERINHVYDLFDHISVSFSGGKDSTAVLNVTLEVARARGRLPLHVFFFDEEAIPIEVEEYVRRVASSPDIDLDWYTIPIKHRNASSRKHPYWYTWGPEDEGLWVRPKPPEGIEKIHGYDWAKKEGRRTIPEISGLLFDPAKYGSVGMLLGIRTQESVMRYRAVSHRVEDNYIVRHNSGFSGDSMSGYKNVWKAYPIYDWQTSDVWTAPNLLGWDYCKAYDLWEMAGISHSQQRLAPPYGEEPAKSLWKYQVCHPELWAKMSSRVPGAATAARYSMTEIYGFNIRPEKPEGMTWEEAISQRLKKFNSDNRAQVAERLKNEIDTHYRKTPDPILGNAPHPLTGLSWSWLLMIAERGDFKRRRMAEVEASRKPDRGRAEYAAARLVWEAEQKEEGLSEGGTRY